MTYFGYRFGFLQYPARVMQEPSLYRQLSRQTNPNCSPQACRAKRPLPRPATAQFIQTGAAEIGVIALSLALAPMMKEVGRYWEVPLEAYPRIEQGGVILSWATDVAITQTLRAFVVGPEGKAVQRRYGFFLPGE
jgi:ABC-type molybdate transport system substrate-binding protein